MADYRIVNDPNRCVKCGLCIAFCPCEVLEADEEGHPFAARIEDCVGCTTCAGNCPQRALSVEATGDAVYDPFADEPRAEPIARELREQYAEWQRVIMEKLGLRWQPVAVSLIDKDEPLPDVPLPPENQRFCQAMMAARRGASILMPPHRHSCPDGTSIFGMTAAREAGHRRDIRAVPQGGERRGRRPDGGRAPHAAAEEPPCHLRGAPGEDGAQARGGGGDRHARADDVAVHVHELLLAATASTSTRADSTPCAWRRFCTP